MNNNIYYCTVSQTRGLSAEMPIGDPFGGPAYGKREMPVAVIAMAGMSFAAGAAIVTATGATLAAMVVGGAMMAGGALTIVGTVTKNEKMTKIGGVLSLAGGVGAMGLGMTGGLTAGAGEAAAVDGAVQLSGPGVVDGVADVAMSGAADSAVQLSGPGMEAVDVAAGSAASDAASAVSQPASATAQQAAVDASTAVEPAASPFAAQSADTMVAQGPDAFKVSGANDISGGLMRSSSTDAGAGGYFDKLGKFVKENKELTKIGTDMLGGLVPNDKTQAETDYIRSQEALNQQKLAEERRRSLWRRGLIG